ncbi:MAG TPA: BrnT family toxin [Pseudobdellovibrionaceae bacterium]|nr:BrnT family toxin [Pseudobdellovibrionaceae bacterium]
MYFDKVQGFNWDEGNSTKSFTKHGVTKLEAEEAFFNSSLIVAEDVKHSTNEPRYHLLGKTNSERKLHITFVLREILFKTYVRVISSRDMSKKEREIYEKES